LSAAEKTPDRIDAIHMQVGVNMGDHAETTWRSVEVGEDETVRSLMERLIPEGSEWRQRDYDSWVRLSFVQPRPPVETQS
jgi:hypothetical protein